MVQVSVREDNVLDGGESARGRAGRSPFGIRSIFGQIELWVPGVLHSVTDEIGFSSVDRIVWDCLERCSSVSGLEVDFSGTAFESEVV